jgi:tRNA-specific 2-thiouridylase
LKAVSLLSGGLDSQLAICLIKRQGIEVVGVNFKTPFFGANDSTKKAARDLGIQLHVITPGQKYMDVLKNPVYGYGKNINPCIDCHAFMLKMAGEFMKDIDASFLITGEVLGQRPMSQNKTALGVVEKLSGLRGLIVRPLSAKLLPATIPETEGWIDREQLLDISGRSRTRQMQLAQEFGITDYPSPAGGCLLTEPAFARRLRIHLDRNPDVYIDHLEVLKAGRQFYLNDKHLLVVGRNHADNERLTQLALPTDYLLKVIDHPGPVGLLRPVAGFKEQEIEEAAAIVARYSDARTKNMARVKIYRSHGEGNYYQLLEVAPGIPEKIAPV